MATTSITNSCRRDWLTGSVFNMATDTITMALYNGSSHGANTTAFTQTAEASGTGYTTGGQTLDSITENLDTSNNVAFLDFADEVWTNSTITATDCMIYNNTVTSPTNNVAMYIGDFSGSRSSSSGSFTVVMPAATFSSAVIRIA